MDNLLNINILHTNVCDMEISSFFLVFINVTRRAKGFLESLKSM